MAVYLIHFDRPYKHSRHYLGYATDVDERLERHC
jgi:predicted GIY-YIG superfamily endonuclease